MNSHQPNSTPRRPRQQVPCEHARQYTTALDRNITTSTSMSPASHNKNKYKRKKKLYQAAVLGGYVPKIVELLARQLPESGHRSLYTIGCHRYSDSERESVQGFRTLHEYLSDPKHHFEGTQVGERVQVSQRVWPPRHSTTGAIEVFSQPLKIKPLSG